MLLAFEFELVVLVRYREIIYLFTKYIVEKTLSVAHSFFFLAPFSPRSSIFLLFFLLRPISPPLYVCFFLTSSLPTRWNHISVHIYHAFIILFYFFFLIGQQFFFFFLFCYAFGFLASCKTMGKEKKKKEHTP